jgi:hypothetical protein
MPIGLLIIAFDPLKGPNAYATAGSVEAVDSVDTYNSIFMGHAGSTKPVEKLVMELDDVTVVSKFIQRKKGNTMERYVLAILLDKSEKTDQFQDALDTMAENIWDTLSKPQLKVNIYLREQFSELTAPPPLTLDVETIRQRVKSRAKDILDDSDQIDQAQQLLSFSKTVPDQLVQAANDGAQFRGDKKYDKSVKSYDDAKRFAKMLQETELADEFDRQSKRSAEIPILERNRDKAMAEAREALRREEYGIASNKFREAAELSDKLGDVVGKEINGKKSEILGQYAEIDAAE